MERILISIGLWGIAVLFLHFQRRPFLKFLAGFIGFFYLSVMVLEHINGGLRHGDLWVIETIFYIGLMIFYPLPRHPVFKVLTTIGGSAYIYLVNQLIEFMRLFLDHRFEYPAIIIANNIVLRLTAFTLIIFLYYLAFTKPHIQWQKVGGVRFYE